MVPASDARPRGRRLGALALAIAAVPVPVPVRGAMQPSTAATPDDSHKAAAQRLFEDGRAHISEGNIAEACVAFAESQRLDPALGTRFNLADCYEQQGRLASAWVNYVAVADESARLGQMDRAQLARAQADALSPRLSFLTVEAPDSVAGFVLTRDGVAVGEAQWGVPVPIDGGEYVFAGEAPGYEPWMLTVTVADERDAATVTVPPLVARPTAPPPKPIAKPGPPLVLRPAPVQAIDQRSPRLRPRHVAGIVVSGIGLGALGVGAGFGVHASRRHDDAQARCPEANACFPDGANLMAEAKRAGNIATAGFIVGGVVLAAGIALLATAHLPRDRRRQTRAR